MHMINLQSEHDDGVNEGKKINVTIFEAAEEAGVCKREKRREKEHK